MCYITLNSPISGVAMASKRSRKVLTMAQKKEIYDYKEKNTKATQDQIAEHFSEIWSTSIARRTVGDSLKWKADWNMAEAHSHFLQTKHLRTPKFATVEV